MAFFSLTSKQPAFALPLIFLCAALVWWLSDAMLTGAGRSWLPLGVAFVTSLASYTSMDPHSTTARYWFTGDLRSVVPLDPDRLYLSLYPAPQAWFRADMTGMPYGATTRPGSTSMFGQVHLVDGYSPVAPAGVARLFDFATHGHINPARVREIVIPEAGADGLLEKLGVDGIIVARQFWLESPLPSDWKLIRSDDEGDVYHRVVSLPHVRILMDDDFGGAAVRLLENSRQRVVAEITPNENNLPVRVAYSRPYFPGYRATLNGSALPVTSLQGLAPTVEIPAGRGGRLELVYRPRCVTVGGAIAGVTLVLLVVIPSVLRRSKPQRHALA
jgi:hypothetical protein